MPSLPAGLVSSMIELSTVAGSSTAGLLAVAARLEADGVHGAVHLRHAEDLLDLVLGLALGDVDRLAAERARLLQPLGNQVADDDHRGAQQLRASGPRRARPVPAPAM